MKVLHVCNWASGITTRNVVALKQHSKHSHELVARIVHPYNLACEPTHLIERDTTRDMVMGLAEEADALHFHAVGYDGSHGHRETIHGIDWSRFLDRKVFIFQGMIADPMPDGSFVFRHGDTFKVDNLDEYDALLGPHLSCKMTYDKRLQFVPDIIPINDWLYTPKPGPKRKVAATFKDLGVIDACQRAGLNLVYLRTPTKLTIQLAWRRDNCRATSHDSVGGAWGLFAMESLSQGIPCIVNVHPINRECWDILDVPPPPFFEVSYGGAEVPDKLRTIFEMSEPRWQNLSAHCRRWMECYYRPQSLVRRWDEVYDSIFFK